MMVMIVQMIVVMMVIALVENKNACQIYSETNQGHPDGFRECNLHRIDHPVDRLSHHPDSSDGQKQCTGITGQHTELACTESKKLRVFMFPGQQVGNIADPQCKSMSTHMPPIC